MAKMAKRRDYGEGSVYKRSDGRYAATVRINGQSVTRYAKDEKTTNALRKQLLKEAEQGLNIDASKSSLKDYLEHWVKVHRTTIRDTTYLVYLQSLQRINPYLGHIKLRDLKPDKIQLPYREMLENGSAATTVRLNHRVLKAALGDAVDWGYLSQNPISKATPPKEPKRDYAILTLDEAAHLLAEADEGYMRPFIALALGSGMRRGEIQGLRWSDINFAAKTVQVNISASLVRYPDGTKKVVESEPKTASGRRIITLPDFVITELQKHKKRQEESRIKAGKTWQNLDLVFCGPTGKHLAYPAIHRQFQRCLTKAGLPHMCIHDLRYSLASILLAMKVHPKVVQEILGHSSIAITMNTYSHLMPTMHSDAVKDLDTSFQQIRLDQSGT